MRAAAVVTVLLLVLIMSALLALCSAAPAADRCLTRSEARALWPRTHLYWNYSSGVRCWSNRRGGRGLGRPPRQAVLVERQLPAPPLPPLLGGPPPGAVAGLMPPRWQDWPVDSPEHLASRWAWAAQALATDAELSGPVFSTFDGAEPDVWPALPQQAPFNAAGLAIVMLAAWLAVAFGFVAWNRNRNRVRLTNFHFGN